MPKETCVEPVHQLPSNYRIMVNGSGEYKVQKLIIGGWKFLWWKSEKPYWEDCWRYEFAKNTDGTIIWQHPLRLVTFKSKSEACEYICKEQEKEQKDRLSRQWKDAGKC